MEDLKRLHSEKTISEESLAKWDRIFEAYVNSQKIPYREQLRFYTYLYAAQKEAAFLSYNIKSSFEGNLDILNLKVAQLFFPRFNREILPPDYYSEKLAEVIYAKLSDRYEREKGNWIAWIASPASNYFPPSVSMEEIEKELKDVKKMGKGLTKKQKQQIYYWQAGGSVWIKQANDFLFQSSQNIPLARIVFIRNLLTLALYDTSQAVTEAKHYYNIPRPGALDKTIRTPIAGAPGASYPSHHAALCSAAATILSYFFPEKKPQYEEEVKQCGLSRLYAMLHYPIDITAGQKMGEKIAYEILLFERNTEHEDCFTTQFLYPVMGK